MNQHRLAALTHALRSVPSRRDLLRGLAGAGLGLGALQLPAIVDAKNKRKRKKQKPKAKPNAYGCLEVGDPCKSEDQCCSGICEGKKGNTTCRAHGTETCAQGELHFCVAGNPFQVVCGGSECLCLRTTAGSNFCGTLLAPSTCAACKTDADCEALGLPPGSACAPYANATGHCSDCDSGMACIVPCGTPPPE